jgi:hypothetical protein
VSVPPLLHLYAPDNSHLDFTELQKWPGECAIVRVPEVGQADFLTFALHHPVDRTATLRRDRVPEKFSSITRLTREFLQTHLAPATPGSVRLTDDDRRLGLTSAGCAAQ